MPPRQGKRRVLVIDYSAPSAQTTISRQFLSGDGSKRSMEARHRPAAATTAHRNSARRWGIVGSWATDEVGEHAAPSWGHDIAEYWRVDRGRLIHARSEER